MSLVRVSHLIALAFALLLGPAATASAEEEKVDAEYKAAVSRLLEVQNTPQSVGDQVSYAVAQQSLGALVANGIAISEEMSNIIFEEAQKSFGARFGKLERLTELYAPIYAENFSKKELEKLIAFWESPVGKKTIELMPAMTEKSFGVLDEASAPYMIEFQHAVDRRFEEAGIQVGS